jgi:hypothetical protein
VAVSVLAASVDILRQRPSQDLPRNAKRRQAHAHGEEVLTAFREIEAATDKAIAPVQRRLRINQANAIRAFGRGLNCFAGRYGLAEP